jgi:hypothetical protein
MAAKPMTLRVIDPAHVNELFASGINMAHPYGRGLIEMTLTSVRHDPQAIFERRDGEAPAFVVIGRFVLPEEDASSLAKALLDAIATGRKLQAQMIPDSGAGSA